MRKVSVVLALVAAAMFVSAGDVQSVRKAIDQKEQQFVKAMKTKDAGWFEKNSTPDFKEIDKGKTYTRAESMAQTKQMMAALTSVQKVSSTITSIKMVGKNAVVVTETVLVATLQLPGGKPGKLSIHSTEQETWVPVGKDWKVKEIRGIKETDTLNGKPLKMAG